MPTCATTFGAPKPEAPHGLATGLTFGLNPCTPPPPPHPSSCPQGIREDSQTKLAHSNGRCVHQALSRRPSQKHSCAGTSQAPTHLGQPTGPAQNARPRLGAHATFRCARSAQVLLMVITPYTRIRIPFISKELNMSDFEIEMLLVSLILDGKISGRIDQLGQLLLLDQQVDGFKKYSAVDKSTTQLAALQHTIFNRIS